MSQEKIEEMEKLMAMPVWKRIATAPKRWVPTSIDRQHRKYLAWVLLVSSCFLYNAYAIPLRSSYPYQTADNLMYWMIADYICDVFYLIDMIVVKPRLQYIKGGMPVKDKKLMRKHYLNSIQFKFDLVSVIPLDVLYLAFGPKVFLRVCRIAKILSFWEFNHFVDSVVTNPYVIRIGTTLSYMIYIIHCNSCVYYSFSAWQAFGAITYPNASERNSRNSWVYNGQGNAYIRCFYFTTKLATSIGNNPQPTNVLEYIYMTFSWMMGIFVFALLLGQIRDIVATANRNREVFRKAMDTTLLHCQTLKLPQEMQDRVRHWFIYTWQQQKVLNENEMIEKLPKKLQTDLAISVHYQTLSKVQLFQDCDKALLRDLVLKLKPVLFLPGDYVCKKGEVGKEMYIVSKGIVEVVGGPTRTTVFATLKEGSVFGEISLLATTGSNRRTADVKSKGFSNLFVLSKDDLNDTIADYPDAQRILKRKARNVIKNDAAKKKESQTSNDLEKMSSVSAAIPTPKLLSTVVSVLKPSQTSDNLKHKIEEEEEMKHGDGSEVDSDFGSVAEGLNNAVQAHKGDQEMNITSDVEVETLKVPERVGSGIKKEKNIEDKIV